jgi:HEAT repeat protein
MCRTSLLVPTVFCLFASLAPGARADPPSAEDIARDEQLLRGARVGTDGPALLEFFRKREPREDEAARFVAATLNLLGFFRKRGPSEEERQRVDELVGKLGSRAYRLRERAMTELIKLGLAARPALGRAAKDKDPEIAWRAQECLDVIDQAHSIEAEAAAVRLLGVRRPDGACRVLLDYLPSVRHAAVEEAALAALLTVGIRGGKVDDALARALDDKEPSRRAAAALVLGRSGTAALKERVRELLKTEADPEVRLRGAQGLLAARDKRAVPVLVQLVSDASTRVARESHEVLSAIASDVNPADALGDGTEARKMHREAWEAWWKDNESKLDLAKDDLDQLWERAKRRARMEIVRPLSEGLAPLELRPAVKDLAKRLAELKKGSKD